MKKKRKTNKAILFDFDGVLIQSEGLKYKAHKKTILHYGGRLYEGLYLKDIGYPFTYVFNKIRESTGLTVSQVDYRKKFKEFYSDFCETEIKEDKEIVKVLEYLNNQSIPFIIVTSSDRVSFENLLVKSNLKEYVKYSITKDDVSDNKPSPVPYKKALKILNVDKENSIAFEDSVPGIISAQSAGIKVVAVKHTFNNLDEIDDMIEIIEGLSLKDVKKQINKNI